MGKKTLSRRRILKSAGISLGFLALRGFKAQASAPVHFTHGVASGDPLMDRVILWTRLVPGGGEHASATCRWQVASDNQFKQIVSSGVASTSAEQDYTVKADAKGLSPGTQYYYRFVSADVVSPVGMTRTLPVGDVHQFRIGLASCSNYPQGFFNAYQHMAGTNLDLVLHLGDYIYEYEEGIYANPAALEELGRHVEPLNEIVSIEDYRMRYGLYRTDPGLQALHARHPFICIWDDHDIVNNTWKSDAEDHDEGEGDFQTRVNNARKAYHEWLPTRTDNGNDQGPIYRNYEVGNLADLILLDTRLHGRDRILHYSEDLQLRTASFRLSGSDKGEIISETEAASVEDGKIRRLALPFDFTSGSPTPVTDYELIKDLTAETLPDGWHYLPDSIHFKDNVLADESRTILGFDQEQWLSDTLKKNSTRGATWQVLGQQVLMGKLRFPILTDDQINWDHVSEEGRSSLGMMQILAQDELPLNLDNWDGYSACRDRVFRSLEKYAKNPIVLSGDSHNAWAFNLKNNKGEPVGIEIGAPGITSPGLEKVLPVEPPIMAQSMRDSSPEVFDLDTFRRGWSELVLTPATAINQWHFVDTVLSNDFRVVAGKKQVCQSGQKKFS